MDQTDELRARILARPPADVLARRRQLIEDIRRLQVSITPMTVIDLRRDARKEEESTYGHGCGMDY